MSKPTRKFQRPTKLLLEQKISTVGAVISAETPRKTSFVEFQRKNTPIAWQPWVQFPPSGWDEGIKQLFQEMVDAWNEKYAGTTEEDS